MLNVTRQGAAHYVARIHFRRSISRMDILFGDHVSYYRYIYLIAYAMSQIQHTSLQSLHRNSSAMASAY